MAIFRSFGLKCSTVVHRLYSSMSVSDNIIILSLFAYSFSFDSNFFATHRRSMYFKSVAILAEYKQNADIYIIFNE